MLFAFFAFYDIALTPLAVGYPVEILPYKARAKGLGLTYFGIYGAQVFNNYANPLALAAIGYYYYIVYSECIWSWTCSVTQSHTLSRHTGSHAFCHLVLLPRDPRQDARGGQWLGPAASDFAS